MDFASAAPLIAKGIFGLGQSIFGGGARKRAEKDLEKYAQSFSVSPSIMDYYNKALARYTPSPYQSQYYQQMRNVIGRNLATGISAAQDRRSGVASVGALTQQANDASARAAGTAESMQRQQLAQLGSAAQAKNAMEQKKFDMLYNLKAMKAGQAATRQNQGMQNLYGALSDYSILKYLKPNAAGGDSDDWVSSFMAANRNTGSRIDASTSFPG